MCSPVSISGTRTSGRWIFLPPCQSPRPGFRLIPEMSLAAAIRIGERTVLECLLCPMWRASALGRRRQRARGGGLRRLRGEQATPLEDRSAGRGAPAREAHPPSHGRTRGLARGARAENQGRGRQSPSPEPERLERERLVSGSHAIVARHPGGANDGQ